MPVCRRRYLLQEEGEEEEEEEEVEEATQQKPMVTPPPLLLLLLLLFLLFPLGLDLYLTHPSLPVPALLLNSGPFWTNDGWRQEVVVVATAAAVAAAAAAVVLVVGWEGEGKEEGEEGCSRSKHRLRTRIKSRFWSCRRARD